MDETSMARKNVLDQAAEAAIDLVRAASPQARVADCIEWARTYQYACDEARQAAAGYVSGFARDAADAINRADFAHLTRLIVRFDAEIKSTARIAPTRPPLMPGEREFARCGWSGRERDALQTVLLHPLGGVAKGDYAVSIDANGATLASGRTLARAELLNLTASPHVGRGALNRAAVETMPASAARSGHEVAPR